MPNTYAKTGTEAECRHCHQFARIRNRGLCRPCHNDKKVRSRYQSENVHGVRMEHPDPSLPPEWTRTRPGSPEKLLVMAGRVERGFAATHPLDISRRTDGDEGFEGKPEPVVEEEDPCEDIRLFGLLGKYRPSVLWGFRDSVGQLWLFAPPTELFPFRRRTGWTKRPRRRIPKGVADLFTSVPEVQAV